MYIPSKVFMTVERILISSTDPVTSETFMLSPIWIGRSNIRKSPEIRFDMTLWLANPITIPAIPPATRRPERSTLSWGRAARNAKMTMP